MKVQRNAPCPCGSGKKYKHCCLIQQSKTPMSQRLLLAAVVLVLGAGAIAAFLAVRDGGGDSGGRRVWSEEHQHWHTEP
jgi:hypothetical protein